MLLRSTTEGLIFNRLIIYLLRPIEWDGQKDVTEEAVSPGAFKEEVDPVFGNGIYYWQIINAPGSGKSLEFKISFTFTAYETSAWVDPDKVLPYDKSKPLYKLYTRPERFIKSTDPQIVEIANQVAGTETNPYKLAQKFYEYVVANAHYYLVGKGLLGAKALLTNGEGECGDFSALFIALARAKGIPARSVVGYWAASGINQTHVWAEFYIEGLGWIPVDPTMGQKSSTDDKYYFGNMDDERVILDKGYNIPLVPTAPDNYLAPLMQVPYWWFWGDSGDLSTVSMERTAWTVTAVS